MATFDDLKAEVAEITTVTQSVVAFVEGLAAKLEEALAQNDPAAMQAAIDELKADAAEISEVITANT